MLNATSNPFGIRAVLFDVDGVLVPEERTLDRRRKVYLVRRLQRDHQIPPRLFRPFFSDAFHDCLIGRRDLREALEPYLKAVSWKGTVDDFLFYWFSAESTVDERLLSVVARLRQAGVACYIASNQERYRADYLLDHVGLRNHFDGWFFSHRVGTTKYSPSFYQYVLEALSLVTPANVLYWDDVQLYTSNAKAKGIRAHLYIHFDRFERIMASYFPKTIVHVPGRQSYAGVKADAAKLIQCLYGDESLSIRKQSGGLINQVFEVTTIRRGKIIVKLHTDRGRVALFERARDVTQQVQRLGVPVPSITHVGTNHIPYAFATYPKLPGRESSKSSDVAALWKKIGSYARLINSIKGEGYGTLEFWHETPLWYYGTWHDYIGVQREQLLGKIAQRKLLSSQALQEARAHLSAIQSWEFEPRLVHGNLALKNTLVSRHGEVTGIIDWDDAFFSRVPHHELARTLPWITPEEGHAFLSGYGTTPEEWRHMRRDVWQLQLLTYLDYMNWFDQTKQHDTLGEFQDRVRSILDLLARSNLPEAATLVEQK